MEFGITLLETGDAQFSKPSAYDWTTDGVLDAVLDIETAYANSSLPDKPPSRLYRDWLLAVRGDVESGP